MRRHKLTLLVCAIVLAGAVISLAVVLRTRAALDARAEVLRRQNDQLIELASYHRQLSNLLAQAAHKRTTHQEQFAELKKLRDEADSLRRQTNELAKQLAARRRETSLERASKFGSTAHKGGSYHVVSDDPSEEYSVQLYKVAAGERSRYTGDARNLSRAVREYARANQGQIPTSFDQAAPYAYKGELPLGGTYKERDPMAGVNDFELVFQGSLNELTNIPKPAVALIRQRQPWQTPNGKWGRIYTMADGRLFVVESGDNFQAWETEHIIPAR